MKRLMLLIAFFTFSFATLAFSAPPATTSQLNIDKVNLAARLALAKTGGTPVTMELREQVSRRRAASTGSTIRTPDAPQMFFSYIGIDDQNNLLVSADMYGAFEPLNPVRFSVNGTPTDRSFKSQTQVNSSPGSPFDSAQSTTSELHFIVIKVPGKLGTYNVEGQVDWSSQYYFGADYKQPVTPLTLLNGICTSGDSVVIYLLFNPFDGKFPATPILSINGTKPESVFQWEKDGFFVRGRLTMSKKTYASLQVNGFNFLLQGNTGETTFTWQEYLPPVENLGSCAPTAPPSLP